MCNAVEMGVRVVSEQPWVYRDDSSCSKPEGDDPSSMACYFPQSELLCPGDVDELANATSKGQLARITGITNTPDFHGCDRIMAEHGGLPGVRAAATEFLFSRVSKVVVDEAERQLSKVFPNGVPPGLVTCHVRWGDKKFEMHLRPIEAYIDAIRNNFLTNSSRNEGDPVHVYLATEDPEAIKAFKEAAPDNWRIYVDPFPEEFEQNRIGGMNGNNKMSKELRGRPGLVALGSLLVAMEANDFVITSKSNWSRLINELRKLMDLHCDNCTRVVDLSNFPHDS